jgi:hypothetical protein
MSNENHNETFLAELLHKRLMFVEATRANDFSEGILAHAAGVMATCSLRRMQSLMASASFPAWMRVFHE